MGWAGAGAGRAQGGAPQMAVSEDFESRTRPLRTELLVHCYQMLGSIHDAEDLVQETMLRAWRAYDRYDDQRASIRTWLYRIATNVCLTALENRGRRPLPSGLVAAGQDPNGPLEHGGEVTWLQPFPVGRLALDEGDPVHALLDKGRLRLALVAAMQVLPARQRAALIMRDVLDLSVPDVAAALETTVAGVNSALQRARARLADASVVEDEVAEPADPRRRAVVDQYVAAFERCDVSGLTRMLAEDVVLEMPPFLNWYAGREAYAGFIERVFATNGRQWRMIPVQANGQPSVAAYVRAPDGSYRLNTVQVFDVADAGIRHNVTFPDPVVFDLFGLPPVLGAQELVPAGR
ncbi:MAG: sigma-70 family RNA polymerase sigma factor [Catenulispora sp.]